MDPNAQQVPSQEPQPVQPAAPAPVPINPGPQPMMPPGQAPVIGGSSAPISSSGQPKSKKRLIMVTIIVLVILLAGGYVFGLYLPNRPGNVFKASLSNTATGYDQLVNYVGTQQAKHYSGGQVQGSLSVTEGSGSGDGTFSGQENNGNAQGTLSLDVAGQKFNANVRAIKPANQQTPDVYFQLNGIKSLLDTAGLSSLDSLDGQWVAVDHTVIDGIANDAAGNSGSQTSSFSFPSSAQVQDALQRLGTVNRQYLFATDAHAVLQDQKYLGTSTLNGRSVYGFQVSYNKANMKAYLQAAVQALDSSQLNAWFKQVSGGQSISENAKIGAIDNSVDTSTHTSFVMYVDSSTKLIRQIHLVDPAKNDPGTYLNLNIGYTGGNQYPFGLDFHSQTGKTTETLNLGVTLNTATNSSAITFGFTDNSSGSPTKVSGNFSLTPSNNPLSVTAPTGAKPITDVLQSLGLSTQ